MEASGHPARQKPAMSIVHGGPLRGVDTHSLGEALQRAARHDGPGDICYLRSDGTEERQRYRELLTQASKVLRSMRLLGVRPHDTVVLHIDEEQRLLTAFWACVLGGFVPMPVGSGLSGGSLAGIEELWRPGERVWTITSAADATHPGTRAWLGHVEALAEAQPTDDYHATDADDLAVLLLTSGSTGTPKAVTLSHRNVLSRCVAATTTNALDEHVRSFNWMPLDHVGGLLMFHVRDVYLRCSQVHAPMDWVLDDPLRWLDAMSRFRSTMTWAPNFAFRLVNDRIGETGWRDWDLSSLEHIMNGGEPIHPGTVRRFLALLAPAGLPPTAMFPGWGMSETSAGVVDWQFDPSAADGDPRFMAVGKPHPGVSVRVVDEHDRVVNEGAFGLLQAAGDPVTSGYYNNPEQNRDSFTDDGWLRTSDLAMVEDGVLVVAGRVGDVITIDGTEYHGHEIEAAVEELGLAECSYTVASAVRDPGSDTDALGVFFHPRAGVDPDEATRRIRDAVRTRFGFAVEHVVPVDKADVPKTEIGKLRRLQLRQRLWVHRLQAGSQPVSTGTGGAS